MKGILRPRQWYSRVAHLWDGLMSWSERWRRTARKPLFPRRVPGFESLEKRQLMATVSFALTEVNWFEAGSGQLTVNLSSPGFNSVSVDYATSNGTAIAGSDKDYLATSGTLNWGPMQSDPKTITITLNNDSLDEDAETVIVTLSNPVNATLGDSTATGIIQDDDPTPTVKFSAKIFKEDENVLSKTATITVVLSQESGRTVYVDYETFELVECGCGGASYQTLMEHMAAGIDNSLPPTTNAAARGGEDFNHAKGTLEFAPGDPGDTSKTFTVSLLNDELEEGTEELGLRLTAALNAKLPDFGDPANPRQAILRIIDDDVTYDDEDQPEQITFTGGATREWTYDGSGRVLTFTDELSLTTTYTYRSSAATKVLTGCLDDVTGCGVMIRRGVLSWGRGNQRPQFPPPPNPHPLLPSSLFARRVANATATGDRHVHPLDTGIPFAMPA